MAKKIVSISSFLSKKYDILNLPEIWKKSFGEVEMGSRWLIYGKSGSGKTEFCVQLSKMLSLFCDVLYLSREQEDKSSLQVCFKRNMMQEVDGYVKLATSMNYQELFQFLSRRKSPDIVIIDSIDYMNFTAQQYTELSEKFKNKMFIFISWADGKKPKSSAGQAIEFMADIKIIVDKYVAFPRCRYGGNEPYIIWSEKAYEYHPFLQKQ